MTTPDQIVGDEIVGEMRRNVSRVLSDLAWRAKDDRVSAELRDFDKEAAVVLKAMIEPTKAMIAAVPYDVTDWASIWRIMARQAAK
jgi:hypothetical protein